jgi:hypothetical protein
VARVAARYGLFFSGHGYEGGDFGWHHSFQAEPEFIALVVVFPFGLVVFLPTQLTVFPSIRRPVQSA